MFQYGVSLPKRSPNIDISSVNVYKGDLPDSVEFADWIAVDTEAMGLNINHDRLCLAQVADSLGGLHVIQFDKNISAPNFARVLADSSILKIFHFARFDCAILMKNLKITVANVYCTKIGSRMVRTFTDRHSLKELCRFFLDVEISKAEQTSDWGAANLSVEQLLYAVADVAYLGAIKEGLDSMLKRESKYEIGMELMGQIPLLIKMDLINAKIENLYPY